MKNNKRLYNSYLCLWCCAGMGACNANEIINCVCVSVTDVYGSHASILHVWMIPLHQETLTCTVYKTSWPTPRLNSDSCLGLCCCSPLHFTNARASTSWIKILSEFIYIYIFKGKLFLTPAKLQQTARLSVLEIPTEEWTCLCSSGRKRISSHILQGENDAQGKTLETHSEYKMTLKFNRCCIVLAVVCPGACLTLNPSWCVRLWTCFYCSLISSC